VAVKVRRVRSKSGGGEKVYLTCVGCSRESEVTEDVLRGREAFKCPNLACSYVGTVDWAAKAAEVEEVPSAE